MMYIQKEVSRGNLVKIKNRSTKASERSTPIADGYSDNASAHSIYQDDAKSQEENIKFQKKPAAANPYAEYDKPITIDDVRLLREIIKAHNNGKERVSINDFTSEDIQAAQKLAVRYWTDFVKSNINPCISPFFRAWFGEYRAFEKKPIKKVTDIGYNKGTFPTNEDTGWKINVNRQVGKETNAHKGISERTAVKYLPYIDDITKKAILLDSTLSDDKNKNSMMYHSLYAYTDVLGYPALLKIKVEELFEYNKDSQSIIRRDYILQNIEEEKLSESKRFSRPHQSESFPSVNTIADLYSLVNTYDKDFHAGKDVNPALLNEDGTPKVFYHGRNSYFTSFGKGNKTSQAPDGSYFFTDNESIAYSYTGYKNQVELATKAAEYIIPEVKTRRSERAEEVLREIRSPMENKRIFSCLANNLKKYEKNEK